MSFLQTPQSRGRLALVSLSSSVVEAVAGTTKVVVEVAAVGFAVAAGLGSCGRGDFWFSWLRTGGVFALVRTILTNFN